MATTLIGGPIVREMERDKEGHREYKVTHLVKTSDVNDGPYTVLNTAGLPTIGSLWNFGNDFDAWAFCYPDAKIKVAERDDERNPRSWSVEQKFSTRPLNRCQDETIEDPLLEPDRVSGSFVKYTKEVNQDRFGNPIKTSSHEMIRGPIVEFDHNRPTVRIQQNVATLGLSTFSQMIDTVNNATLWGLGPRRIKLSNVSWERLLYGLCNFYYTRTFEFDIDFSTFDRAAIDEGTKVLNGHWSDGSWVLDNIGGSAPDKNNPNHFIRYKDRNGENARAILDGNGEPIGQLGTGTGTISEAAEIDIDYYSESNFLLLGIPTSF